MVIVSSTEIPFRRQPLELWQVGVLLKQSLPSKVFGVLSCNCDESPSQGPGCGIEMEVDEE